ncbi:MAG: hypothetical protein H0S79_23650, partial [Anaerolineaceae bacterium]|nr:hypothetical protein [Anaerolineaceae bacterium]
MFDYKFRRGISVLIGILALGIFSACQQADLSNDAKIDTQTITPIETLITSEPEQSIENMEPVSTEPLPTPDLTERSQLDVPEPVNSDLLGINADGTISVFLDDENLSDRNHPAMPSYIWHLNANLEGLDTIVVEFDLIDTVDPNDLYFYGYDRGFFIGLHNLDDVSDLLFYYSTNSNEWDASRI